MIYVGAPGVPSGGSAGQVLAKNTAANGDATWASAGVPSGGTAGQVLTKNTATAYDASWAAASSGGGSGGYYHPWAASTTRAYVAPPVTVGVTTNGMNTQYAVWYPVRIPNACTVASISVYCNTSAAVWIGMYTDVPTATSGGPAVRLTGGTTTGSATAYSPVTVAANYTFSAATNIWVCFGTTNGNAFVIHNSGNLGPGNIMPAGISSVSSTTNIFPNAKYNTGYSSGAPTNGAAADVSTVAMTNAAFSMPIFAFVVS